MTIVLSFVLMLLIVAGMSVGVMAGRKPIAGSCGGMKALGLDTSCEVCGGNPAACDSARDGRTPADAAGGRAEDLAVDATAPRRFRTL